MGFKDVKTRGDIYAKAFFERLSSNSTNEPGSREEDRVLDAMSYADRHVCQLRKYPNYDCNLAPGHIGPCHQPGK